MCVSTVCVCVAVGKRVERHSLCPVFTSLDFKHPIGSQDCFSHYSTCDSHYTQHIAHYTHTHIHILHLINQHTHTVAHMHGYTTQIYITYIHTRASFTTAPLALFKARYIHIQSSFKHCVLYITENNVVLDKALV